MVDDFQSYIGDIGTHVKLYLDIDLTGYSLITIIIKRPTDSGGIETLEWTADVESIPNGIIYHVSEAGDFSIKGIYTAHGVVDFSDGRHFTSKSDLFRIWAKWE